LPPSRQRIDNDVAGFSGTAEGHRELSGLFIEDPTRDILLRLSEIMVKTLGSCKLS
jgi:hypothetical protein